MYNVVNITLSHILNKGGFPLAELIFAKQIFSHEHCFNFARLYFLTIQKTLQRKNDCRQFIKNFNLLRKSYSEVNCSEVTKTKIAKAETILDETYLFRETAMYVCMYVFLYL